MQAGGGCRATARRCAQLCDAARPKGVTIVFRGGVARTRNQTCRGSVASALVVVSFLASACGSSSPRAPVSLPVPKTGEVTFYLSLPSSTAGLGEAAAKVATPRSADYRHFSSLSQAARQFGATDAQINTVADSVKTLGLQFAADPTRLFGRVTGSTQQWQAALGTALSKQGATASSPFITYTLPQQTPAALEPSGTRVLLSETQVYDPTAEGSRPPSGSRPTPSPVGTSATATTADRPWPFNNGIPLRASCSAPVPQQRRVYTPQQVQTATASTRCAPARPASR
jgi:hypothetical protein